MAVKTSSTGQFVIPTSPAAGTAVSSGAANTYTTTYVQLLASTAAAIYIIGAGGFVSSATRPSYMHLQIATGSAGAEAIVGQIPGMTYTEVSATTGTSAVWYTPIAIPIPVATATRIAAKTADSIGALVHNIQLYAINQANVVDAGIIEQADLQTIKTQAVSAAAAVTFQSSIHSSGGAVASVTGAVASVTAAIVLPAIPANWITAAGVSSNAIATQATGVASSVTAAVTLPAIPANWITAAGISSNAIATQATGIASSVTAAVVLPAIPTNWITAAGVSASAFAGKGDWNVGKSGYSLTQSFPSNFSSMVISSSGFVQIGTNNDKTGYTVSTVSDKTGYELDTTAYNAAADALLDRVGGAETNVTVRQSLRLQNAVLLGKASGLNTTSVIYRDIADTKNRIAATVDSFGNRSVVVLDST